MSEEIKGFVRRYIDEIFTKGNLSAIPEFVAENYVNYNEINTMYGPDGLAGFVTMLHETLPDVVETIEEQLVDGDNEVHRWVMRGTHRGPFLGFPPTGKQVELRGLTITRVADGKIVEEHSYTNSLAFLQQIEAFPGLS
jgi:steroid delta-isomerase-like uncharacterized protein